MTTSRTCVSFETYHAENTRSDMLDDSTADIRGGLRATINANVSLVTAVFGEALARELIEQQQGQVWNADELARDFDVLNFSAPLVVVRRKVDGALGSLFFSNRPRFYWAFRLHDATEQDGRVPP
jgi:hypothetical protein